MITSLVPSREGKLTIQRRALRAPGVSLEREEMCKMVPNAIAALKPRYRELVILKVQEGKSYREIAEITGLSATNVGYLLHQAMKALSLKLKDRDAVS